MVGMLLVVSDYDGTLAAIVDDPELAFPNKKALGACRSWWRCRTRGRRSFRGGRGRS